jgi:hypothetical protein
MQIGANQASSRARPLWRRLVSALAIYALVLQPLLMAIEGSQLAQAAVLDDISLSQLCAHNSDSGPAAPSDQQKYPYHDRCIQCFAGAYHFLDAPEPVTVALTSQEFRKFDHPGLGFRLSSSSLYSVARPRGPPTIA